MSPEPPQRNKHGPNEELNRIGDAYIFDSASGLYKRKSEETEDRRHYDYQGRFRVSVARDWIIVVLNVLTLAVVFAYTYYAKRTVGVMKENADRPWVQIGEDKMSLSKAPEFDHIEEVGFGRPSPVEGTMMEVVFPLPINNVGTRIAKRYSVWADLIVDTERNPHPSAPWGEWWEPTCKTAENNMQGTGVPNRSHPLLPGISNESSEAQIDFIPEQSQYIRTVYIVACVTYREMSGEDHFTAITYCPNVLGGHPVKVLDNPEMFFDLTETRFWACNHEAD
jgi:hypothetical protein